VYQAHLQGLEEGIDVISIVKPTRCTSVWNLASRQQYLFDKCLLLYVQSLTPEDGRKDRAKHV